jgi:phospholipase/carboxylesterase
MPRQVDTALKGPNDALPRLFALLDTLGTIARQMHPGRLPQLVVSLAGHDEALRSAVRAIDPLAGPGSLARVAEQALWEQVRRTADFALQACDGLRGAANTANPMLETFRAMRRYSRALEAVVALEAVPAVGRYLLEPGFRDDPAWPARLAAPANPDTGVFHFGNQADERGGFSVYVPPWYDPAQPHPIVVALHGGAGHGRLFLWNWVPHARTRGLIVVAPTAIGGTWSLRDPEIDSDNLRDILTRVGARWNLDPSHRLLTGMSDGGTFTLLSGLDEDSPFTHLAPVAAAFHPMLLAMTEPRRLTGLPIYLVHGALDWMFPVDIARTAHRALAAAGAAIVYRELADLSHAYPRDEQGAILDWLMAPATAARPP